MLGFKEDLLLYYLLIPIKLDPYSTLIGLDFTVGWTSNVSDWYTFLPSRIISFRSARSPLGMNSVTGPPPTVIQRCHLVACPPPCLLAVLLFQPCLVLATAGQAALLDPALVAFGRRGRRVPPRRRMSRLKCRSRTLTLQRTQQRTSPEKGETPEYRRPSSSSSGA
jgi:hypothetical protein